MEAVKIRSHPGPSLGALAIAFVVLFNIGLSYVVSFSTGTAHFPGPWESSATIADYFRLHSRDVLMCSFFQFGSAIPLGLFVVNMVGRLRFLGVLAAGPSIALFGGLLATTGVAISALLEWVMAYPDMAQDASVIRMLYYAVFAIGGVGYSVPLGIFFAGVSVSAGFARLLPAWIVTTGVVLALCGELSWFSMVSSRLLFFIPVTRFLGFIWMIFVGFILPRTVTYKEPSVMSNAIS